MAPFGETVLAWRLTRGMTQAGLARAAGIPRPNLSAIERGDREVTLKTLRAIAVALDVRPGALVDGELPVSKTPALTRAQLERIAGATAAGRRLSDPREARLSELLAATLATRLREGGTRAPSLRMRGDKAYFLLRASEEPAAVASLIARTMEKLPRS